MADALMSREEVDTALERLTENSERIAASLVAMDTHPGHRLLRGAALTGLTERRWAEASEAMTTLWEQFSTYRAFLDQAREIRDRRSRPGDDELAELTRLLRGPVVELNSQHIPIERRSLTGPAVVTERITLTELLGEMNSAFTMVTDVLASAESAWSTAIGQLDPLEEELRSVSVLAETVAPADPSVTAVLDRVRDGVDQARQLVLTDPLTMSASDPMPTLRTELADLKARLDELATVRDTFDRRLTAIDLVISDIEAAEVTARQTYTAVLEKIASPGIAEPTDEGSATVRARMRRLEREHESGQWQRLSTELDELDRLAATTLTAAKRTVAVITGLLDRRAELRGRLEAYRVKAARVGLTEDLELERLHRAAHDLLFTAPCDLAAATRALNRYRQAMQERETHHRREERSS